MQAAVNFDLLSDCQVRLRSCRVAACPMFTWTPRTDKMQKMFKHVGGKFWRSCLISLQRITSGWAYRSV